MLDFQPLGRRVKRFFSIDYLFFLSCRRLNMNKNFSIIPMNSGIQMCVNLRLELVLKLRLSITELLLILNLQSVES